LPARQSNRGQYLATEVGGRGIDAVRRLGLSATIEAVSLVLASASCAQWRA
jgi:hypothetical protein